MTKVNKSHTKIIHIGVIMGPVSLSADFAPIREVSMYTKRVFLSCFEASLQTQWAEIKIQ